MAELRTLEGHTGEGKMVLQQEQAPKIPPPEPPKGPKKYEFIEGGSSTEGIVLAAELKTEIVDRLQNRIRAANSLASKGKGGNLSVIDRLILSSGEDAINNFKSESSSLTVKDLALAWSSINDELLQKSLASGRAVGLQETETQRQERRWFVKKVSVTERRIDTRVTATDLAMTTPYTTELGVGTWLEDKIVSDLEDLHNLRLNLARSLGVTGSLETFLSDPTLVDLSGPTSPIWQRKVGFLPHDAVVDELTRNEKILKLYENNGAHNFLELQAKDPKAAAQALYEANQAALTTFAGEIAQSCLKGEKPSVDTAVIESQADKLKGEPKPEEVNPLLATRLRAVENKFKTVDGSFNKVIKEIDDLTKERSSFATEIESLPSSGLTPDQESRRKEIDQRVTEIDDFIADRASSRNNLEKDKFIAQADLESIRTELRTTINNLLSPEARLERQEKATALDKWAMVAGPTNYEKIINARFTQAFEDQFTLEKLASIDERDGEISGAERIREHTFWLIDKTGYDPKLARLMLSDEAIAKAIIWTYKLDAGQITDLKTALSYLKSSQFKAGDLLRFVINEGLKSAERGNPYLTLDEYFAKPKPELQLKAESIYREGIGEIKTEGNSMLWEGRIANAMNPLTFSTTVPKQNYWVALGIDRNLVNYNLYAKTDRGFLELLPDSFDPSLPEEAKIFYDESSKLSTDKPGLPKWIKLYAGASVATDDALNSLDGMISREFSQLMTSATADYFLRRSQQERLQLLRGFRAVDNINDVALAENPAELHNYQIRLNNNDNFFIQDVTDPDSPKEEQELSSFFQKRLKDFKGSKLSLSQDERKTLQEEFLKILSPLGREILRAQQRR